MSSWRSQPRASTIVPCAGTYTDSQWAPVCGTSTRSGAPCARALQLAHQRHVVGGVHRRVAHQFRRIVEGGLQLPVEQHRRERQQGQPVAPPQRPRHQRRRNQLAEPRPVTAHRGLQREGAGQRQRVEPRPPREGLARRWAVSARRRVVASSARSAPRRPPPARTPRAQTAHTRLRGTRPSNTAIGGRAAAVTASPRHIAALSRPRGVLQRGGDARALAG